MIFLRKIDPKRDVGKEYLKWMNNYEVFKYTEQKNTKHSLSDIRKFVKQKNISKNEFLYGIFLKNSKSHIGNIKLGPNNYIHKSAYISYFIGDKKLWNKGYTTKAIKLIIGVAKTKKIKKLKAGIYEINRGSEKVLTRNGFKKEGILKSEVQFKDKRYNVYIFGKLIV